MGRWVTTSSATRRAGLGLCGRGQGGKREGEKGLEAGRGRPLDLVAAGRGAGWAMPPAGPNIVQVPTGACTLWRSAEQNGLSGAARTCMQLDLVPGLARRGLTTCRLGIRNLHVAGPGGAIPASGRRVVQTSAAQPARRGALGAIPPSKTNVVQVRAAGPARRGAWGSNTGLRAQRRAGPSRPTCTSRGLGVQHRPPSPHDMQPCAAPAPTPPVPPGRGPARRWRPSASRTRDRA